MFRPSEDDIELTVADEALATLEQVGGQSQNLRTKLVPHGWNQLELIMLCLFLVCSIHVGIERRQTWRHHEAP